MKALRGWGLYLLLLAIAAAASLAAGGRLERQSPLPSITNPGAFGTRALYVYLQEIGADVRAATQALTPVPEDVATVILPMPAARTLTADEVSDLTRFVDRGGTLVVLTRGLASGQPSLDAWLGVRASNQTPRQGVTGEGLTSGDPAGADAEVLLASGPFTDARRLRVSNQPGITVSHPAALPAAASGEAIVAWRIPEGRGEVLVLAGTDTLENRRLELRDNLRLWHTLAAQGPVLFDEFHLSPGAPPPVSAGMIAVLLQLGAVFLAFVVARGSRLGPPRPLVAQRHRSMREYLDAFAWLVRRARVETDLLVDLHQRFRRLLQDRLGIPLSLSEEDAARELEARCHVPESAWLELVADIRRSVDGGRASPREFARLSRRIAALERVVTGRDVAPRTRAA